MSDQTETMTGAQLYARWNRRIAPVHYVGGWRVSDGGVDAAVECSPDPGAPCRWKCTTCEEACTDLSTHEWEPVGACIVVLFLGQDPDPILDHLEGGVREGTPLRDGPAWFMWDGHGETYLWRWAHEAEAHPPGAL